MTDLEKLVEQKFRSCVARLGSVEAGLSWDDPLLKDMRKLWDTAMAHAAEEAAKHVETLWEIDGTHTAKEFAAAIRERFKAL